MKPDNVIEGQALIDAMVGIKTEAPVGGIPGAGVIDRFKADNSIPDAQPAAPAAAIQHVNKFDIGSM